MISNLWSRVRADSRREEMPVTRSESRSPVILRWVSKEVPHQRSFGSLEDAVRVAMKELRKAEFLSASIATDDAHYAGDQIVEIFQTGGLKRRGYARF